MSDRIRRATGMCDSGTGNPSPTMENENVALPGTIRMRNDQNSLSCEIVSGHCPLNWNWVKRRVFFGTMQKESKLSQKKTYLVYEKNIKSDYY